jgi:hypothetical protein
MISWVGGGWFVIVWKPLKISFQPRKNAKGREISNRRGLDDLFNEKYLLEILRIFAIFAAGLVLIFRGSRLL